MHFGPNEILVALSLDFRNDLSARDVEDAVARLEHWIRAAYPQAGRIYVVAQSLSRYTAGLKAVVAGERAALSVRQALNPTGRG